MGAVRYVETRERQGFAVASTAFVRCSTARMGEEIGGDRLLAANDALTDELLLQFQCFIGKHLRYTGSAVVVQGRQAAEV